jgi:hypothetical protein
MPTAQARNSPPVTTKLAIWTHPRSPRLSRLSGWRLRSNPSRVKAWVRPAARNNGPATMPQASNREVRVAALAGRVDCWDMGCSSAAGTAPVPLTRDVGAAARSRTRAVVDGYRFPARRAARALR